MTTDHDDDTAVAPPAVSVRLAPGVAVDALDYVRVRLSSLAKYAPGPITTMDATVARRRDAAHAHVVVVRASLTVGGHVLQAHAAEANLRASLDEVCDRLCRQLTELPHGRRGDYVRHRRNSNGSVGARGRGHPGTV
ncbi:MAG TPA: HPF/RaiA family ribosome-associated protein [Pseudonocardiaceae bacterium]|nr:HPF/RaiA family ribosome-associated protein [Pseudonocardiaceae bacterium]